MIDHPAWQVLQNNIAHNVPEYLTLFGAACIAAVCTMPKTIPASLQELWTWLRDALQTAVPAARAQHISIQTVETPQTKTVTASETNSAPSEPNKETLP